MEPADFLQALPLYFVILLRVAGLFTAAPILSSRLILPQVKIALTIIISLLVFMVLLPTRAIPIINFQFIIVLMGEFFIGVLIGFVAHLVFDAIQLAGQSIDMQMGFGIVNVMDPQTGRQVPMIGNFKHILALLIFLVINGHHWLLEALFYSYEVIPIDHINFSSSLVMFLIDLTSQMFVIALKLAAPIVGALFITEFIMGIFARLVPQMNVFLVGMPLKIIIGFLMLIMVIPLYVFLLNSLFEQNLGDLLKLFKVLACINII